MTNKIKYALFLASQIDAHSNEISRRCVEHAQLIAQGTMIPGDIFGVTRLARIEAERSHNEYTARPTRESGRARAAALVAFEVAKVVEFQIRSQRFAPGQATILEGWINQSIANAQAIVRVSIDGGARSTALDAQKKFLETI